MDHGEAVERVESWLSTRGETFRRLESTSPELPASLRAFAGISILLSAPWANGGLILWFRPLFPMRPPQIYFAEGALPQRLIPHVDSEGQICTLPNGVAVNPEKPEEQVDEVLKRAEALVTKTHSEAELIAEVEDELCAYWTLSKSPVVFLEDDTLETNSTVRLIQKPLPAKKDTFFVKPLPEGFGCDVDLG